MMGNLALQGIKGVRIMDILLSLSPSIVLVAITPGTLQPDPTINGIKDLPLNPKRLNTRSKKNAIRDI